MAGRPDYRSLRQLAALLRKQSMVDASALLAFSLFHSVHNLRPWDGTTHIQRVSSLLLLYLWKHPQGHSQKYVFYSVLNIVTFTMKINHHTQDRDLFT